MTSLPRVAEPADVTVVIPSYGRPEVCRVAVLSALAQTRRARQVILVVDGEDVSGYDDIEAHFNDPTLVVVRTGKASGAAGARNIGVQHATTRWIAFLDDDDLFLPHKIEVQLGSIERAGLDDGETLVLSTTALVADDGVDAQHWPGRPPLPGEAVEDFLFGLGPGPTRLRVLSTVTLLVSRQLLLDIPMRGRAYDDWDWQIRGSRVATTHHVDRVLSCVALSRDGLTGNTTMADGKAWLETVRPIISDQAYAAATLTVLGRLAGEKGTMSDAGRLLVQAARSGAPIRQLIEYPFRVTKWRMRRSSRTSK